MFAIARDDNFKILDYDLPYTNLVWLRRYYDFGQFQMQLPIEAYDHSWVYVTSPDAEEIGIIQESKYESANGGHVLLSGFFAEKLLDNVCIRTRFTETSSAQTIANKLVRSFYDYAGRPLDIVPDSQPAYGPYPDEFTLDTIGDSVGTKIYEILQTREMSQKVYYHGAPDPGVYWRAWSGIDRTKVQSSAHKVVLNDLYGDITDVTFRRDVSAERNTVWILSKDDDGVLQSTGKSVSSVPSLELPPGRIRETAIEVSREKDETDDDYRKRYISKAQEELDNLKPVVEIDAQMVDPSVIGSHEGALCDLGDVVTLELPNIGVTADVRIIEVEETYTKAGRNVRIGMGSKRITNIERAMNSWKRS